MPTPAKPVSVLKTEKKSHRTKSELEQRERAEASLLTGKPLQEHQGTKQSPEAHKLFFKLRSLLKAIGKADALYSAVVNRYCVIFAECSEHERLREEFRRGLDELREEYHENDSDAADALTPSEYYKLVCNMQGNINQLDRALSDKRKMLLSIEKECCMTIASALRAIPKKEKEADEDDPLAKLLGRGRGA